MHASTFQNHIKNGTEKTTSLMIGAAHLQEMADALVPAVLSLVSPACSLSEESSAVPSSEMKEKNLPVKTPKRLVIDKSLQWWRHITWSSWLVWWWTRWWFTEGLDEKEVSEEESGESEENEEIKYVEIEEHDNEDNVA